MMMYDVDVQYDDVGRIISLSGDDDDDDDDDDDAYDDVDV